jgi:hypothetical protein
LVGAVDVGVVARVVDGTTTDLGAVVVGAIAASRGAGAVVVVVVPAGGSHD